MKYILFLTLLTDYTHTYNTVIYNTNAHFQFDPYRNKSRE